MKPWLWMTLCLGCMALAGCRANSYRTMLEQESRQWEDRYYVVKDRLDQCQSMLEATRQRNLELEESAGGPGSSGLRDSLIFPGLKGKSSGKKTIGNGKPAGSLAPPSIEAPGERFKMIEPDSSQSQAPEEIGPGISPDITPAEPDSVAPPFMPGTSPGEPVEPDSVAPPFMPGEPSKHSEPRRLEDPVLPPDSQIQLPGDKSSLKPQSNKGANLSGDSSQVARIELIEMPTDGYDADGSPGDDGVQFVLQPRDANGKTVAAAAPVSIVVVDPAPQDKPVRLARWDLTPEQAAGYHDRSPQGFHLRLPWPGATPKHSRLRLFARYTTADGRKVQAEKAISVALADEQSPNWKIDPPLDPSQQPVAQRQPATPRSTLTLQPPPNVTTQPQPEQPREAKLQRQQAPTQRKRPVWSPDRP